MKNLSQLIRSTVIRTGCEELFVTLRRNVNVFRKLIPVRFRHKFPSIGRMIPGSASYPADDSYQLTRDKTVFRINRSDYVQWRLFYGVRDNALKEAKKCIADNTIVLDIGSNFGAFALKLASFTREQMTNNVTIHAFEPNPVVAQNFLNNLWLNPNLRSLVTLHPYGLGQNPSTQSFSVSESNTGAGRVVQTGGGKFEIAIKRLDDVIKELKPAQIGFIKMIAEGYEPQVFEGGWQTICHFRPPIFFEVTPSWWNDNGASVNDILDKLRALGYAFTIEHYNEMIPYDGVKFKSRTQFNLLARIQR